MSILNSVLKIFVGDKNKKDLKTLLPIVDNVLAFESAMKSLSNDEMRGKTLEFKEKIKASTQPFNDKISAFEEEIKEAHIDRKEEIYTEIDSLKDQAYEASEITLKEIMPEAFALIKETARRFTENETISVIASPYDRELSGIKDSVELDGDKAIYYNTWDATGKQIVWDMIFVMR